MVERPQLALKIVAEMMYESVKNYWFELSFTSSLFELCRPNICNSLTGFNLPRIAFKSSLMAAH